MNNSGTSTNININQPIHDCIYQGKPAMISDIPWYRKDKFGWPIEIIIGRPIQNFIRIMIHGIIKKII